MSEARNGMPCHAERRTHFEAQRQLQNEVRSANLLSRERISRLTTGIGRLTTDEVQHQGARVNEMV